MSDYHIDICKKENPGGVGKAKTEIWAEILDKANGTTTTRLIWWEDRDGSFHDETPYLPAELRDHIDNAWIQKRGKL